MRRFVPRSFPIASWTKNAVLSRLKDERSKGAFGLGAIEPTFKCHDVEEEAASKKDEKENIEGGSSSGLKKACILKLADAETQFANAYAYFVQSVDEARVQFSHSKQVLQMQSLANAMKNLSVDENEEFESSVKEPTQAKDPTQPPMVEVDDDDEFYSRPSIIKVIEKLEKLFTKKCRARDDSAPTFNIFSQDDGVGVEDVGGSTRVDDEVGVEVSDNNGVNNDANEDENLVFTAPTPIVVDDVLSSPYLGCVSLI